MHCVAPTTCIRKLIIAEVMFLDSSKMGGLMLSPVAQVCFLFVIRTGAYVNKLNPIYALLHLNYEKNNGMMLESHRSWF